MSPSEDTEAIKALKLRLAKGEITLQEYEHLRAILETPHKIPKAETRTEKKPRNKTKPPSAHKKIIAIAVICVLAVAIVLIAFVLPMSTTPKQKINQVLIKVEYGGNWQGAYGDQTAILSWSGTGSKTVTLNRPSDASIWMITANAQKMDGSSSTLRIMITKTDGTILKEGSTSAPYGVAQIGYTIQDQLPPPQTPSPTPILSPTPRPTPIPSPTPSPTPKAKVLLDETFIIYFDMLEEKVFYLSLEEGDIVNVFIEAIETKGGSELILYGVDFQLYGEEMNKNIVCVYGIGSAKEGKVYIDGQEISKVIENPFSTDITILKSGIYEFEFDTDSEDMVKVHLIVTLIGKELTPTPTPTPTPTTNYHVKRVSSGKIAYDTFSASDGTATDTPWTFSGEGWTVEDGKLRAGQGSAYPTDVLVTDGIWEVKIKPMTLVREGPEMILSSIEGLIGPQAVFDYYHVGRVLRVMTGPDYGSLSTYKQYSFEMSTNTWYTMKVAFSKSNMKCYINDILIFDVTDPNVTPFPSAMRLTGFSPDERGEWGYWDDVKVWKSNTITVTNLVQGQKVELFDASNSFASSATVGGGENNATLDVSALSFPFKGYFKIYATDGTTLLYTTPLYGDIWGGDEYPVSVFYP